MIFTPPVGMTPLEFCGETWQQKTSIVGLPDSEEIMTLAFFVFIQYWRVTDRQTDRHTLLSQRPALA